MKCEQQKHAHVHTHSVQWQPTGLMGEKKHFEWGKFSLVFFSDSLFFLFVNIAHITMRWERTEIGWGRGSAQRTWLFKLAFATLWLAFHFNDMLNWLKHNICSGLNTENAEFPFKLWAFTTYRVKMKTFVICTSFCPSLFVCLCRCVPFFPKPFPIFFRQSHFSSLVRAHNFHNGCFVCVCVFCIVFFSFLLWTSDIYSFVF